MERTVGVVGKELFTSWRGSFSIFSPPALLSAGACLLAECVPSVTKRRRSGCWAEENDSWLLEKGWSRIANNS